LLHGDRRLGASDSYVSRSTAADETT
jgi:hypothetical protein